MSQLHTGTNQDVLIVHPDLDRAREVGFLFQRTGLRFETLRSLPDAAGERTGQRWDLIVASGCLLSTQSEPSLERFRNLIPCDAILVGLVDDRTVDSPALFGAGVDLILYEPLVEADIERAIAFGLAVRTETREQARSRLRKMTALHELAVAAGHRTGTAGWLDRLVDAGRQILGPEALAMWSVDRAENHMRCIGSSGLSQGYITAEEARSVVHVNMFEQLPRRLDSDRPDSCEVHSCARKAAPDAAQREGIKQTAWLPVRDSNRYYGHLGFYFKSEASVAAYDLVLADAFASIVAGTLGTFWLQSEIRRTNRLYREQVESSPEGVIVCLPDGTVERSNPAVEQITGRDRYEIIGESIFEWFVKPEDLPWDEWQRLSSDEPAQPVELWLSHKTGERRRVSCYARGITFPDPRRLGEIEHRIQVVVSDITVSARRLIELELFHDLSRLISGRGSLEDAYDLVVSRLYNYLNYRLVAIGEVVERSRLELQAYRTHMEDVLIPQTLELDFGLCGRAIRENRSLLVADVSEHPEYVSIDDNIVSELVAVIRAGGDAVGLIDIQTDETQQLDSGDLQLAESIAAHLGLLIEQVTIHERLERQAMTDSLTGMANRRAFMRHLQKLVNDRHSPPAALLLVELDHFKGINDRFGHLFGDEMLKQTAGRLKTALREDDILARYGGDEIAMIFHNVGPQEAVRIAERLRIEICSRPFEHNGAITDLTVSIGIALFPYHGRSTDELIGEADRAMYAAKLGGRNSVNGEVPIFE